MLQGATALRVPLALVLAVVSGEFLDEDWLRDGQFQHLAYSVHLLAWLLIALAVSMHLCAVLRRGGLALAGSMVQLRVRSNDTPSHWPSQLIRGFRRSA